MIFSSSAPATKKGLKVDPGSKKSVMARLRHFSDVSPSTLLGLNPISLAIAKISPVLGSMTMASPPFAPLERTALLNGFPQDIESGYQWLNKDLRFHLFLSHSFRRVKIIFCLWPSRAQASFSGFPFKDSSYLLSNPSNPLASIPTNPTKCAASSPLG